MTDNQRLDRSELLEKLRRNPGATIEVELDGRRFVLMTSCMARNLAVAANDIGQAFEDTALTFKNKMPELKALVDSLQDIEDEKPKRRSNQEFLDGINRHAHHRGKRR